MISNLRSSTLLSTLALCLLALPSTARPQAAPADDPKAAALINQAAQLEALRKFDDARKKLDEARAVNPHQSFLWSNYAYLATVSGKLDEAVQHLEREITEHPDEQNAYLLLTQVQQQQHKPQDAIHTLDRLIARFPGNEQAVNTRASLFLAGKQYPEAEKALRAILAAHPDSVQAQLLLATALAHEDKKPEATALLKSLVKKSNDAGTLNNAAYTLADEDLDPALAEQTARRALTTFEQQAASAGFDTKPLLSAEILVSLWDTLGWALFHQGKAAQAEPWLRAAWTNSLGAEPGFHLGTALEKLNQPAKALAIYQLAKFGDDGSDAKAVLTNIAAREQALRKAGTPSQIADGKAALQAQHTFKVPGANTLTGSALVQIEFSAAGASNAMIVREASNQSNLTPVEIALYHIDYKVTIPPGTHSRLTRRGLLTCHAGAPCQFTLLSTRAALAEGQ
jgi:tetratricopeptide (TPR) repeat protein